MSNEVNPNVWVIKDYTILLQNLFNRATEIEIHNATIEKRKVDLNKVEENLKEVGTLVHKKIEAFKAKL